MNVPTQEQVDRERKAVEHPLGGSFCEEARISGLRHQAGCEYPVQARRLSSSHSVATQMAVACGAQLSLHQGRTYKPFGTESPDPHFWVEGPSKPLWWLQESAPGRFASCPECMCQRPKLKQKIEPIAAQVGCPSSRWRNLPSSGMDWDPPQSSWWTLSPSWAEELRRFLVDLQLLRGRPSVEKSVLWAGKLFKTRHATDIIKCSKGLEDFTGGQRTLVSQPLKNLICRFHNLWSIFGKLAPQRAMRAMR